MTPLPPVLQGGAKQRFTVWRLERAIYANTWDKGLGAEMVGGRWSPKGQPVIYTSLDPATAILEVAVHTGFDVLDAVPHHLMEIEIVQPSKTHIVHPQDVPNPNWLRPGAVSEGMQKFGGQRLSQHPLVLLPSVVSTHSWNLLIDVKSAAGLFKLVKSEPFGLDGRLNKPQPSHR